MTIFEWAMIAFSAVALIAIAALFYVNAKLNARIKTLAADYSALEEKFAAVREQNQQELLAIGQRVLEADKIVRRFSERLDAIESNPSSSDQPQYGQLQNLLKQTSAQSGGDASLAEKELMSLLLRNRKLSS